MLRRATCRWVSLSEIVDNTEQVAFGDAQSRSGRCRFVIEEQFFECCRGERRGKNLDGTEVLRRCVLGRRRDCQHAPVGIDDALGFRGDCPSPLGEFELGAAAREQGCSKLFLESFEGRRHTLLRYEMLFSGTRNRAVFGDG